MQASGYATRKRIKTMQTMRFLVCFFVLAATSLPAAGQALRNHAEQELSFAAALLIDTSIRADTVGLRHALHRLEALARDEAFTPYPALAARTHYHLGFAHWQLLTNTNSNPEDARRHADEALEQLQQAVALQENLPEAYVVSALCYWALFGLAPERSATLVPKLRDVLQKALAFGPQDPRVVLIDGMNKAFDPKGPARPEGVTRLEEAIALFEAQRRQDPAYPAWWPAMAYGWMGQVYLAMAPPEVEKARAAFEHALALRPDYALVKETMLPTTEPVAVQATDRLTRFSWQILATDAEGDGRNPDLADGKALSYAYDARTDSLWFKFDLHRLPNPAAFGINLAFDTDQDPATGTAWWGGNTAFIFDRVVTLWVTRTAGGHYRGMIGMADAEGAQGRRFTNLAQNNLAFGVNTEDQTLFVGFKRSDLGETRRLHVIGTVGSNLVWNDELIDTGSREIVLPAR